MKYATLNNGIKMPILGFGVFQISDFDECKKAVLTALKTGYRLIDTASAYNNEEAVGQAIQESGLSREEIFVTTKLWIQDAGYEKAKSAFEKSLKLLQLDYIDLYLIHQPIGDVFGAWRAMEELYESGKIKAIGISNFQPDRLMDLMVNNKIKPAINQIETHPFHQQIETQKFLSDNGIQIESWGPFAEGKNGLFTNPVLSEIGKKYQKSVAQVTLRWLIQRDVIVIPKSVSEDRIKQNFDVFDFELTSQDIEQITALDTNDSLFINHRNPETVKWLSSWKP